MQSISSTPSFTGKCQIIGESKHMSELMRLTKGASCTPKHSFVPRGAKQGGFIDFMCTDGDTVPDKVGNMDKLVRQLREKTFEAADVITAIKQGKFDFKNCVIKK